MNFQIWDQDDDANDLIDECTKHYSMTPARNENSAVKYDYTYDCIGYTRYMFTIE